MSFNEILNNFFNRSSYRQADVPGYVLDDYERSQQEITEKITYQRKRRVGFGRFLSHPIQVIKLHPMNVLYISVPLAILIFFTGL
ncbi:MAG TPA: type II secretion system F family protein, partial [Methanomicrobiales archaeon]|nr:type II secretion system F family protein [Methanomicrobiales archaeon]